MLASAPAYTWQQATASEHIKLETPSHPYFDQVMPTPGVSILYPPSYVITSSAVTSANWVNF